MSLSTCNRATHLLHISAVNGTIKPTFQRLGLILNHSLARSIVFQLNDSTLTDHDRDTMRNEYCHFVEFVEYG